MRTGRLWGIVVAFGLCAWGGAARAEIDVEIGNGDQISGTLNPGDETETFHFRVPRGASITVKAKALKRGPSLDVALAGPDEVPFEFGSGKSVVIAGVAAEESGTYTVYVSSEDFESTGDYSLSVSWKAAASASDTFEVASGESDLLEFAADEGSSVTISVKPAKGSAAVPELESYTPPVGPVVPLAGKKSKQVTTTSGDHAFSFTNSGDEDGGIVATAKVKPPKLVKRKIALTSRVIGSGNPDGDTAFASVLGKAGGTVAVPPIDEGEPGFELTGSSVTIPPNALSTATAIVIATAPDLEVEGGAGAGTTVFFGPEGAKFDSAATVTIPYDPAFDTSTDSLVIYTRDAKGKIKVVPPPYEFDTVSHTVSFPTSHFSSFRALMPPGAVSFPLITLASGLSDARDVCISTQQDIPFLVAGGSTGTVIALRQSTQPPPLFTTETWAGGGAQTTDGSPRQQFNFGGTVVSVWELSDGAVWVATTTKVFRVDASGNVSRVAGTGTSQDAGDDGPALQASFVNIASVVVANDETVYVADRGAFRIRRIDAGTQTITTFAGTGVQGVGGDGIELNLTNLLSPADIALDEDEAGLYVADGARVRHLRPSSSTSLINVTVAGSNSGQTGSTGDGGPLLTARFRSLSGVSLYNDPFDPVAIKLVVSDEQDATIRVLDLESDVVTLIAGQHGQFGDAPDFSPADGLISTPLGLTGLGGIVTFVDAENGKIRWRLPSGP